MGRTDETSKRQTWTIQPSDEAQRIVASIIAATKDTNNPKLRTDVINDALVAAFGDDRGEIIQWIAERVGKLDEIKSAIRGVSRSKLAKAGHVADQGAKQERHESREKRIRSS